MLAEAHARANIHTEVQTSMLVKAHAQMLAEACERQFLLRVQA